MSMRIGVAAGAVSLAAVLGMPAPHADPGAALPPLPSTGSGPIISGGDEAAQRRMSLQLLSIGGPDVQHGDGSDAAAFIGDAAALGNPRLATAFVALQRVLGCQQGNTSFGARAYRRGDGAWGGAQLVIAKSATADVEALTNCVRSSWPATTVGMCASGWTYPTSGENHRPETYYILLAGTAGDFCGPPDGNYANFAARWP
jgi:hypothetical protein